MAAYRFISESALLVEYGNQLDDQVHERVLAFDAAIRDSRLAALVESQPTYASLLLRFDPFTLSHSSLLQAIAELDTGKVELQPRRWRVPVCFESAYAEDMDEAASTLGLSVAAVIEALLATPLKLYMYGFAPGFAYCGGLDNRLALPRRATPRAPMAEGSLMIAGGLASLASASMPTGWYVVGRTPLAMFVPGRKPMVPFNVGDRLQLYAVTPEQFERLAVTNGLEGLKPA